MRGLCKLISGAAGLLLLGSGCTAASEESSEEPSSEQTYPAPTETNAAVPVDPGIAVTSEQLANSDPCGLLDVDALAAYGEVEIERESIYPWGCSAQMSGGDTIWNVSVRIRSKLIADTADEDTSTRTHEGITVYSRPFDDIHGCPREVAAAPDAVVYLLADSAAEAAENCALADTAIEAVIGVLLEGELPPTVMSEDSLALQNACELLEPADAAQVPDIDLAYLHWSYQGENCTWGESRYGSSVFVNFEPGDSVFTTETEEQWNTDVGGYSGVVMHGFEDEEGWSGCEVLFVYGPLDFPDWYGSNELVSVNVSAPGEQDEICDVALNLAEAAAGRLP